MKKMEDCKFFGSTVQSKWKRHMGAGWKGWRKVSGVTYNKSVHKKERKGVVRSETKTV